MIFHSYLKLPDGNTFPPVKVDSVNGFRCGLAVAHHQRQSQGQSVPARGLRDLEGRDGDMPRAIGKSEDWKKLSFGRIESLY